MEGDGSFFDMFVNKKADKDMDSLDAADILDPSRRFALEKFFKDLVERGDEMELNEVEKLWKMDIPLPTTLVIYAGFLRGVAVPMHDVELKAQKLGDGSIVLYEDGKIFGFHDAMEGTVYLPNFHEDMRTVYNVMFGQSSSGAGRFRAIFRRIVSVLHDLAEKAEDSKITIGDNAPEQEEDKDDETKPSALREVLFHMHQGLELDMSIDKKREDIEFLVEMRRNFMSTFESDKDGDA
jgi:hypothetical protein